jgi:adenylylsulfate reductase subunit B
MPTYVNPDKCDGCKALAKPACMYICPSNIMHLDTTIGKAYNIEPDLCWEC